MGGVITERLDCVLPQSYPTDSGPDHDRTCLGPSQKADVVRDYIMASSPERRGQRGFSSTRRTCKSDAPAGNIDRGGMERHDAALMAECPENSTHQKGRNIAFGC